MNDSEKTANKTRQKDQAHLIKTQIAKAVEKGVINAFKTLGLRPDNQQATQQDFQFLRILRQRCEESSSLLFRIVLSSTIATIAIALWEGIKVLLKR